MSSFGGTVKLTGESEYKKALAEITSNLRLLNSEMKTVTTQYDKNDTSVENLSAQNEILNKKIQEQQKAVNVLSTALEQSKQETGENSAETKAWQIKLNEAQAELNKLNKQVETNTDKMSESVNATQEETEAMEDLGDEVEKSGEKSMSFGDVLKAVFLGAAIKQGIEMLVNGFKAIGSAMGECLTAGAEYADNILTLSTQTGLSTDTLEKYNAVAELTDVSLETMTSSMARNIKAMGEARDGSKAYAEAYEKLGVSVTDSNGNLRDSETVYWETIDALKGIQNETERDALAMELFGKKAQDLNPIIELGSEGVAEYTQQAIGMGAVLGGDALQSLGKLDDQMQIFKGSMSSTKNILASAFAPAMASALEGVNGLASSFNGLLTAVISGDEGGIENAMTLVSEQVTAMVENIAELAPQLGEIVKNLLSTVLKVLAENLPQILEAGADLLSSLLQGISDNLGTIMPVILSIIESLIKTILENLPMIIEMGIQMITALINGIADMLPELIPMAVNCILTIVEGLIDNLDMIIDAAINIIMSLTDGLMNALPDLIDRIPVIIDKLITAITNNLPKLIEMGIQLTLKLAVGIIKAIPQLVSKIPEIITSLAKGLLNGLGKIAEVGKNLVQGLWNGIKDAAGWLLDKIKGFGQTVMDGIKGFFGIHSPSTLFRDEVGKNLALGVGEGFTDTMKDVTDEMSGAMPTEFDTEINTNINGLTSTPLTYESMLSAIVKALGEVKVVMNGKEMGVFVTDTIERVVYA